MMRVLAVTYIVSMVLLFALVWRAVARRERKLNETATQAAWAKGVVSLNAFRERARERVKHPA